MHAILAIAVKDLAHLLRDRAGALFTFGVPVLFALFFGTVFADGAESSALTIGVVDEDDTELSRSYVERLDAADEVDVIPLDREEASEAVRRGELAGYVALPSGFGGFQGRLLQAQPTVIEVGVDPARSAESALLRGVLMGHFFDLVFERLTDPDAMRPSLQATLTVLRLTQGGGQEAPLTRFLGELDTFMAALPNDGQVGRGVGSGEAAGPAWEPLRIERSSIRPDRRGPENAYEISFPQGLMWGLISCTASFAIAMVQERRQGTLMRLRTAPISKVQILGGKALACYVTTLLVMVVLFGLGALVFRVWPTSWPLFALAAAVVSLAFTGMMMLLGLLGKTERATAAVGWSSFMVMAMFGGGMLPLFFMPEWMQSMSHFSPVKWAVLAIEGTIWRGFSLAELWPSLAILATVGLGSFGIGVLAFSRARDGG